MQSFLCGLGCFWVVLGGGCSSPHTNNEPRHYGPKINVIDFASNTHAYKGRSLTLSLKVDEKIDRQHGQSLRDFVGRDVKFVTVGPNGESLDLVITIPPELSVPDVGQGDQVSVTFLCSLGKRSDGNQAQIIAISNGDNGD